MGEMQQTESAASTTGRVDCYRALFENSTEAVALISTEGVLLDANPGLGRLLGLPAGELGGRNIHDFAAPGAELVNQKDYESLIEKGGGWSAVVALRRADDAIVYAQFFTTVVDLAGRSAVLSIGHDVTDRLRSARALGAAERRYQALVERMPDVLWTMDVEGDVTFVTPNVLELTGFTPAELYAGRRQLWFEQIHPEDRAAVRDAFAALAGDRRRLDVQHRWRHRDGRWLWLRVRGTAHDEEGGGRTVDGLITDITEQRELEERLRQAQKMEAVGQLTGGIAHDFNNILAAIIANSHFLIEELNQGDPRRADAEEIRTAAERAAALTRQLLAFSRNQVQQPKVLDLNTTVVCLEKMLRRLIGEDVDLELRSSADLGSVRADAGQIEQVIMNLVVNARDAMPRGGHLTIETANVHVEPSSALHGAVPAGDYVTVAVSDTGIGMSAETQRRMFEPFFTTKERGKGTGLGLSTCYGIVKQSAGHIAVESELGRGSRFKVYLPRVGEQPEGARAAEREPAHGGHETVLLAEDDDGVRSAVSRILAARGYNVLLARDGCEALAAAQLHEGPIHLVLSDVVLPGYSGPEIVGHLRDNAIGARALFMSGYTDHALLRDGVPRPDVNFIAKPFAPEALAKKVREVLDA
jgi:two-component system cell cycle sensor histidine kinase/response regulator CckA